MQEAKNKREKALNDLSTACGVFWAFNNEQFHEGKAKCGLLKGEKLADIGCGGFMPLKNVEMYKAGIKAIDEDFRQAMQDKKVREDYIRYELFNHEAFYTMSISSTLEALGGDFTKEEVLAVFNTIKSEVYA